MKKLIWTFVLVIWVLLAVVGHADAREEISENELYAQGAVLMDASSGRVLYGKNADQVLAMASTTKIMTCIIALEHAEVSESVEISSYASAMPKVKLGVRKGEVYRLEDLLYSLMLESHNDVAVAIAEHIGRQYLDPEISEKSVSQYSIEESKAAVAAFAGLMNEKAKALGCEDTYFITPNGLDAEESFAAESGEVVRRFHSTTAAELARIMSYCVLESPKKESFLEITQTPSHAFKEENGRAFACYNHNAFLNMMDGVISGKTGFTNRAGYCYVGALEKDGRTFVVALLACGWPSNKNYKWSDTKKLMEYGVDNYFYRAFSEVSESDKWRRQIPVLEGQTAGLGEISYVQVEIADQEFAMEEMPAGEVISEGTARHGLLMKEKEQIAVEYTLKKMLEAPVEEGMKVGEIRYLVDDVVYYTEEIVTSHGVERIDWQWCLEQIFEQFFVSG